MADTPLMRALGFTEADLQTNKRGELSPTQIQKWSQGDRVTGAIFRVLALGLLALTVALGLLVREAPFVAAVPGFFVLLFGWLALNAQRRVSRGYTVASVQGQARLKTWEESLGDGRPPQMVIRYSITIDNREFPISKAAYDLLRDGDTYTIYYPPERKGTLASIEPV